MEIGCQGVPSEKSLGTTDLENYFLFITTNKYRTYHSSIILKTNIPCVCMYKFNVVLTVHRR